MKSEGIIANNPISKTRESNLELLRIICMFSIILLHLVSQTNVWVENSNSINQVFSVLLGVSGRSSTICFVIIGAWFLCDSDFKFRRIVSIWLETVFYSFIISIICKFALKIDVSLLDFIKCFLPISKPLIWFPAVYMGMLFLSPFMNLILKRFNQKQLFLALLVTFFLLCLLPTIIPSSSTFFSNISLFCFVYLLTGYIKKHNIKIPSKISCTLLYFIGFVFMSGMWFAFEYIPQIPDSIRQSAMDYYAGHFETIFSLLCSFSLFFFFKQLHVKDNKIINFLSSSFFAVYLIHQTPCFYPWLWSSLKIVDYASSWFFIFYILGCSIAILFSCILIDKIRFYLLEKPLFKYNIFIKKMCSSIDNIFRLELTDTNV